MRSISYFLALPSALFLLANAAPAIAEDDRPWAVSRTSGEVWLTTSGDPKVEPASLGQEAQLKPGDTIRTGRNGRVLLKRGEESILISPNSVVGVPVKAAEGLSTTIVEQAGSILLDVEKRNVKHFEVETPYLAAVVKGTQFRVTVNAGSTSVDVMRGKVEVADFKSGQIGQVLPGQHAVSFTGGKPGLTLSGSGAFEPLQNGVPRTPSVQPISVPRAGLPAPQNAFANQTVRTLHGADTHADAHQGKPGTTRISSAIGEVKLNFNQVTHGLAHGTSPARSETRSADSKDSIWNAPSGSGVNSAVANSGDLNNSGSGAAVVSSAAAGPSVASTVSSVTGSGTSSGANNNGSGANGNGSASGANGNGNGNANGNGLVIGVQVGLGNGNGLALGVGNGNSGGNGNGLALGLGNGLGLGLGLGLGRGH
jgi:hypothetical protein